MKKKTTEIRHPDYIRLIGDWMKFRNVLTGGKYFVGKYLAQFSNKETTQDFQNRYAMTYCPGHVKSAIINIRNSIFERLPDVQRVADDQSYELAASGEEGGVDKHGSTMGYFMGNTVLTELLFLGKVGILVDKSPNVVGTLADGIKKPYLTMYKAEDIVSWCVNPESKELDSLLLRETVEEKDSGTGLVISTTTQYRLLRRLPEIGKVVWQVYDADDKIIGGGVLDFKIIPFVIGELSNSLLTDVADYQIALLNMESSDVYSAVKNNFSFYVEQYDPQAQTAGERIKRMEGEDEDLDSDDETLTATAGTSIGRRYPRNLEAPRFINPSPEPLMASMSKEDKMREDIYRLVNINLSMMESRHASENARKMDYRGLETNLSYIAMELQYIEQEVAKIWAIYQEQPVTKVNYPNGYELRGTKERREEATAILDSFKNVTDQAMRKQLILKSARLLFSGDLREDQMQALMAVLKAQPLYLTSEELTSAIENSLISREYVGKLWKLPDGTVKEAMEEHAERLASIVRAQSIAKGDDGTGNEHSMNQDRKDQSQDPDLDADGKKKVRGKS